MLPADIARVRLDPASGRPSPPTSTRLPPRARATGSDEPEQTAPGREPAAIASPAGASPAAPNSGPGERSSPAAIAEAALAAIGREPRAAPAADEAAGRDGAAPTPGGSAAGTSGTPGSNAAPDDPSTPIDERAAGPRSDDDLTPEERDVVRELQDRDAEVKRHEEAHAAVGGQYASAPTYTYQSGPDGKQYAVGGQVMIDTAPIPDDPDATIAKMQIVQRAALAPAEPSGQDLKVAQEAQRQMLEAMNQKQEQLAANTRGDDRDTDPREATGDDRSAAADAEPDAARALGVATAAQGRTTTAPRDDELAAARGRRLARAYTPKSAPPPAFAAAA